MKIRKLKSTLLGIYNDLSAGRITLEEASKLLELLSSALEKPAEEAVTDVDDTKQLPCEAVCLENVHIPLYGSGSTVNTIWLSERLPKGAMATVNGSSILLVSEGHPFKNGYGYAVTTLTKAVTIVDGQVLKFT